MEIWPEDPCFFYFKQKNVDFIKGGEKEQRYCQDVRLIGK